MQLRSSPDKQNNGLRWRYQLICNGALGAGVRQYLGLQAQALCYLEHIALGLLLHLYVGKHHADLFDPQRRMRFDGMRYLGLVVWKHLKHRFGFAVGDSVVQPGCNQRQGRAGIGRRGHGHQCGGGGVTHTTRQRHTPGLPVCSLPGSLQACG